MFWASLIQPKTRKGVIPGNALLEVCEKLKIRTKELKYMYFLKKVSHKNYMNYKTHF